MAHVARIRLKTRSLLYKVLNLPFCFQAHTMAGTATFEPVGQGHRLTVKSGHGFHRTPGQGVLSLAELLNLGSVAFCADSRTGDPCFGNIGHGIMSVAMAGGTADVIGAMLAQLPVHDDTGSDAHMAFSARVIYRRSRLSRFLDGTFFLKLLRTHCPQTERN